MQKKVLFGKESRDKMLLGVQGITNAVRVTMGAAGKCVLIGEAVYGNDGLVHLPSKVSKDGYTVSKYFELSDAVEHRGAMIIKEAAMKTVEEAGDATTCTCVLAESLITNGMKLIDEGANSQQLKKGMDEALVYVVEELKKISTPVKGDIEKIRQIATVSANNDKVIGDLIADAYSKIGETGVIDIEASNGIETDIKVSDGFKIDRGWVSPLFVTDKAKETCEFDNPLILLYDKKITHHTQIEKAIGIAVTANKPLVIICEDAIEEGLAYLAINSYQKRFRACVVKAPEFGTLRQEWMEDIALTTGGEYVSDLHGIDIVKDLELSHFGSAEKVVISNNETVIKGGGKDKKQFDDFVNDFQMNLTQAKTEVEKYPIEKRIARLNSSVATIKVGAATETELNEKLDRVDDAVRATKAAISEGFVAGGGTVFLRIGNFASLKKSVRIDIEALRNVDLGNGEKVSVDDVIKLFNQTGLEIWNSKEGENKSLNDFDKGKQLVYDSLYAPFLQIMNNAGMGDKERQIAFIKMAQMTGNLGYNVLNDKMEDMVECGIIDSTKALRCALVNAVSVAGMLLTSECSIVTIS